MINSIREVMKKAIENYPLTAFKEWCLQWPGQVILAASNVYWTADVTKVSAIDVDFVIYFYDVVTWESLCMAFFLCDCLSYISHWKYSLSRQFSLTTTVTL